MIGYKKRKLFLALLTGLLLLLLVRLRGGTPAWLPGPLWSLFGNACRAPASRTRAALDRVRPPCAGWPRDNLYFASRGVLRRNSRLPSAAQCFLQPSGRQLGAHEAIPAGSDLLSLNCRLDQHETRLVMPAVARDNGERVHGGGTAWNVLMVGLGGVSEQLWRQAMPKSFELLSKTLGGDEAIVSRLVPLGSQSQSSLSALLQHNSHGRWITEAFAERHFLTQASVFTSASSPFCRQPPAALNLSSFFSARAKLASSAGCIGLAPEGSFALSWLRDGHLLHTGPGRRLFAFLHFADLLFPSTDRLDAELLALLLDALNQAAFARSLLIFYSLPDWRSGLEPGLFVMKKPAELRPGETFRWDILRSATSTGDFLTPNDLNRLLAFLASDDRPHHLADIGFDARTCVRLGVSNAVCRCIPT